MFGIPRKHLRADGPGAAPQTDVAALLPHEPTERPLTRTPAAPLPPRRGNTRQEAEGTEHIHVSADSTAQLGSGYTPVMDHQASLKTS